MKQMQEKLHNPLSFFFFYCTYQEENGQIKEEHKGILHTIKLKTSQCNVKKKKKTHTNRKTYRYKT